MPSTRYSHNAKKLFRWEYVPVSQAKVFTVEIGVNANCTEKPCMTNCVYITCEVTYLLLP